MDTQKPKQIMLNGFAESITREVKERLTDGYRICPESLRYICSNNGIMCIALVMELDNTYAESGSTVAVSEGILGQLCGVSRLED